VKEQIYITYIENLIEPSNKELYSSISNQVCQKEIGNVEGEATSWNVSLEDESLYLLTRGIRDCVSQLLHSENVTAGEFPDMPSALFPMNSWGVIYNKGAHAKVHNHFPCLWSSVYYVNASSDNSPLCFPDFDVAIPPETGYVVNFPAYMWHYVPPLNADENRCSFAVNWLYADAVLRANMFGYGDYYNRQQIEANLPPNPWVNQALMKDKTHVSITTITTLNEGSYVNRNKRPNKEI
jgi:hypothetical protein